MAVGNATPWATLLASCRNASNAIIVAPYIKTGALARLLDCIATDASLTCVSNWTPQDIASGATDARCRTLIRARHGIFLLHSRLHAKYYRFDDRVLIGSANLTGAGMNITGHGNLEILCPAPPQFDSNRFESEILRKAYPVSDEDFAIWSQIAPTHSNFDEVAINFPHDLNAWKPTTRRPEYLWLAYRQRAEEIPSMQQRQLAETETSLLGIPPSLSEPEFANWIKLNLLTSPFVQDVMATTGRSIETTWEIISKEWGISKQEAAQSIATAEYWIAHFAPDRIITR